LEDLSSDTERRARLARRLSELDINELSGGRRRGTHRGWRFPARTAARVSNMHTAQLHRILRTLWDISTDACSAAADHMGRGSTAIELLGPGAVGCRDPRSNPAIRRINSLGRGGIIAGGPKTRITRTRPRLLFPRLAAKVPTPRIDCQSWPKSPAHGAGGTVRRVNKGGWVSLYRDSAWADGSVCRGPRLAAGQRGKPAPGNYWHTAPSQTATALFQLCWRGNKSGGKGKRTPASQNCGEKKHASKKSRNSACTVRPSVLSDADPTICGGG